MYGIYDGAQVIAKFAAPLSVVSNVPVAITQSASLKIHAQRYSTQRWEISANLEPLSFGAEYLMALLVTKGHFSPVDVVMPQNYGVIKRRTSVATVTATGSIGDSNVVIAGNAGLIPLGTFVKFSNHNKIYMTTGDRDGNGAMGIFPTLRTAVSATSTKHRDDVIAKFMMDTDTVIGMTYTDGILMDLGTIKLLEDL